MAACHAASNNTKKVTTKKWVLIQPMGAGISQEQLMLLQQSIEAFYHVQTKISDPIPLPKQAYYAPRDRYRADSIIAYLKLRTTDSIRSIIGITSADISTNKGNIIDYGVMGLGFCPGKACVISSFRLQKHLNNKPQLQNRINKVAIHELGHNFGLPHCPNQQCLMVDAEGKLKMDHIDTICTSCAQKLKQ